MECNKCKNTMIFWGEAFTWYFCENCWKSEMYHMTCVPKLCEECSIKLNKCERCLNKLDS